MKYRSIYLLCLNWYDSPGTYTVIRAFSSEDLAKQSMEKMMSHPFNPNRTFLSIEIESFDDDGFDSGGLEASSS